MTYVEKQRQLAADIRRRSEQTCIGHEPVDLVVALHTWWTSQPVVTREHPWSLDVIVTLVFARQTRKPAFRDVAEALRQIGFTECRDWTRAGRNKRYWLPPALIRRHNPANFKEI